MPLCTEGGWISRSHGRRRLAGESNWNCLVIGTGSGIVSVAHNAGPWRGGAVPCRRDPSVTACSVTIDSVPARSGESRLSASAFMNLSFSGTKSTVARAKFNFRRHRIIKKGLNVKNQNKDFSEFNSECKKNLCLVGEFELRLVRWFSWHRGGCPLTAVKF